jgi:hypothetical protein
MRRKTCCLLWYRWDFIPIAIPPKRPSAERPCSPVSLIKIENAEPNFVLVLHKHHDVTIASLPRAVQRSGRNTT